MVTKWQNKLPLLRAFDEHLVMEFPCSQITTQTPN
jgi:hypothetical protein